MFLLLLACGRPVEGPKGGVGLGEELALASARTGIEDAFEAREDYLAGR